MKLPTVADPVEGHAEHLVPLFQRVIGEGNGDLFAGFTIGELQSAGNGFVIASGGRGHIAGGRVNREDARAAIDPVNPSESP